MIKKILIRLLFNQKKIQVQLDYLTQAVDLLVQIQTESLKKEKHI